MPMEKIYSSFVRGSACFKRMTLPPSFIRFELNARQTMTPASQVRASSCIHGCHIIETWSMHTQRSAIMFHVKPGVNRAPWPIQRASARSTGHAPFCGSSSRRVRRETRGGPETA